MSDDRLWPRPRYSGHGPAINGFGGVAAPMLAGFSLAAIVTLLTESKDLRFEEWTILAFSLSTVLFLFSIQFTVLAMGYWVLPNDSLGWVPEARRSYSALERLVARQRNDLRLFAHYADIGWNLFHLGTLALLIGLGVLLVPAKGEWDVLRVVALIALGIAVLTQLGWVGNGLFGQHVQKLAMRTAPEADVPPPDLGDDLLSLIADEACLDEMKEAAAQRRSCSWTTRDQVRISAGGLEFRGQSFTPTREARRRGRYFAVAGAEPHLLVVLPDRVLFGCREHVLERIDRFGDPHDAEQLAMLRSAVEAEA